MRGLANRRHPAVPSWPGLTSFIILRQQFFRKRHSVIPVEIHFAQGCLVLRARSSEILIMAAHVSAMQKLTRPEEFSRYFMRQALVNRPARKLFEAWLRKDPTVWPRLYKIVQSNRPEADQASESTDETPAAEAPESQPEAAEAPESQPEKASEGRAQV